ncbi:MAG: hypothetical protein DRN15_11215 [Thermoprotei archaeon]|nr:MAG: hypothetical protein DRN15_11215 [Thermoprotei archaeon]
MGKLREYMEQWLREGLRGFDLAKRFREEELYHVSTFYASTSCEKALKALYYVGRKLHLKTHDLGKLFEMLPSEIIVENQALL